jgi:hypothetical protein
MYRFSDGSTQWSVLYFYSIVMFGNFLLLNLVLVVLVDSFGSVYKQEQVGAWFCTPGPHRARSWAVNCARNCARNRTPGPSLLFCAGEEKAVA